MILTIDNQGISTFTLAHILDKFSENVVVKNVNEITPEGVCSLKPKAIVLSDGPKTKTVISQGAEIIETCGGEIPVLGIGTGMLSILSAFGSKTRKNASAQIGKSSEIIHDESTIFEGIPSPMTVGRYDTLSADEDGLSNELMISAHTLNGEIMGIRSSSNLIEGILFLPEAVLTLRGDDLLANFIELSTR